MKWRTLGEGSNGLVKRQKKNKERKEKKTAQRFSSSFTKFVHTLALFLFFISPSRFCSTLVCVQAETDVITDKWIYLVATWRLKNGLTIYINGKGMAQDKGGVGVQNMKDLQQHDNFFIGRNVGGTGALFANFYIASLVVFNSYLEAPGVFSVSKYYSKDGEIQFV